MQRSGREFRQREKQVESPRVGSQRGLLQNSKETTGQSTMTNKMVFGKRAGPCLVGCGGNLEFTEIQ